MQPNLSTALNHHVDIRSTQSVGIARQDTSMANYIGNVSSTAEILPIQSERTIAIQADSIALHRQLNDVKANKICEMLGNEVLNSNITPDMINHLLQGDNNNINAVLTSFSLLNKEEITPALIKHVAKTISTASEASKEVASKALSKELQNILAKLPNQAHTLQQRFLSEYVIPAIKAKLNETYTDSQLKSMVGLSPEQFVDDKTLVDHFLTSSLLQGKTARFDNAIQSYQKHNLWEDKNACLEQGFRALEEHIETIRLNVPTDPKVAQSSEQKTPEKPSATPRKIPLSSAAPQQSDDVDGVPYQTSSQTSAPIINNYYITNNYACPHCICKVSDTPSRYGSVATTVNIDSAASFQAAPSKTIAQKTATPAAETPTTYRTELHVQLSGDGKIVKQDSPTPPNNATQVDDSASQQPALKDKSSGETSESTEPQTGVNEAILLQSNQEKEAPELPPRHQMGGYTRTMDGKWLPNTQQTAPFVITSGGFNQSTNPVGRLQYSASDSKVESAKPTDQQLIAAQRQRAVDGIDSQSLEEQVTQQTDHLFDAQIQPNSHSHLVDAAKQVATELSNMLDVANRSAMVLKDTSLAAEQATRQLDTQQSLDDKGKPAVQSKASFPLSSHASGIYHAKVAQVVEEQPTATVVIEKESAEPVGALPIHDTETTEKKADSDVTKKKYRWQVNTDNRVYTTSGGQARDLSQKKRYIGDDQRFKLGNGS